MGEAKVHNLDTFAQERSKLLDKVKSGRRLMLPENTLLRLFSIEWAAAVDNYHRNIYTSDKANIFDTPPFINSRDQEELLELAAANMGGYDDDIEDRIAEDEIYTFMVENRENGEDRFEIEERVKMTRLRYTAQAVIHLSGVLEDEQDTAEAGVA